MVLEARHARRAVGDHLAHHVFLAAERLAREHRRELHRRELRLEVADPAGLDEQTLAELLRVVELRVRLLGRCPGDERRQDRRRSVDVTHDTSSRYDAFVAAYDTGGR